MTGPARSLSLRGGWENDPWLGWLPHDEVELLFDRSSLATDGSGRTLENRVVFPFLGTEPRGPARLSCSFTGTRSKSRRSLEARGNFDPPHSLALWERYLRLGVAAVSGLPTLVTDYAALLEDPLGWCEHVAEFLTRSGFATHTPREMRTCSASSIADCSMPGRRPSYVAGRSRGVGVTARSARGSRSAARGARGVRAAHPSSGANRVDGDPPRSGAERCGRTRRGPAPDSRASLGE